MEIQIIPQEEIEKGKPKAYEYFTIVWYPAERPKLLMDSRIHELGWWQQSPMHEAENMEFFTDTIIRKIGKAPIKPHIHLVNKSANKITVNTWIKKLCQAIDNDFTGIALNKEDCGVSDIKKMLRYELHLNNPMKEHFCLTEFIEQCPLYFSNEYAKAFEIELLEIVTGYIMAGDMRNTSEVLQIFEKNCVMNEFLMNRKHLQIVHNMLDENRKNDKERRYKR